MTIIDLLTQIDGEVPDTSYRSISNSSCLLENDGEMIGNKINSLNPKLQYLILTEYKKISYMSQRDRGAATNW